MNINLEPILDLRKISTLVFLNLINFLLVSLNVRFPNLTIQIFFFFFLERSFNLFILIFYSQYNGE